MDKRQGSSEVHVAYRGVVMLRHCGTLHVIWWPAGRACIERGVCIPTQVSLLSVPFICRAAAYNIDEIRALTVGHSSLGRINCAVKIKPPDRRTHPVKSTALGKQEHF